VAFSVQASGHDQDPDTLTYSATGLPSGIGIDSASGLIRGTPTAAGDSNVVVTVSDGALSASTSFALHVVAPPPPPPPPPPPANPLVNPGPQRSMEEDHVELEIQVLLDRLGKGKGRRDDMGVFSATNLPGGLRIDSRDGEIDGQIQKGASKDSPYRVTVTLVTEAGRYSVTFDWTVLKSPKRR